MGLNKCKECGEEVAKDAKACPKCGKDQRNFFKKHPVWCTIGIIVILSIVFGGSNREPKNTLQNNGETSQIDSEAVTKTEYKVGEVYEDDYIAVKFTSKNENFTKYSKYADVKKGYKVLQATFEFENVGVSDQSVTSWDFKCYADGYACDEFYYVDETLSATISSGNKAKGSVYFEVPKNAKEIYLEYELDFWSEEKVKFVVK